MPGFSTHSAYFSHFLLNPTKKVLAQCKLISRSSHLPTHPSAVLPPFWLKTGVFTAAGLLSSKKQQRGSPVA